MYTFTTKTGASAFIRPLQKGDVADELAFINSASAENTFLLLSGEVITMAQEVLYVSDCLAKIESGDLVKLCCFIKNTLVGDCTIERITHERTRSLHIAKLGIIVKASERANGIGEALIKEALKHAKENLKGVRMVTLDVVADNIPALILYQKLGFKECGRLPGGFFHKGEYLDLVHMYLPLLQTDDI